MRLRTALPALAALSLAAGLSACSSGHTAAPGNGGATTTAGPTTSTSATSAGSSTTTTTGVLGGVACAASSLVTTVVGSQGAAGTFELTFGMRNSTTSSCPMNGFPGAQLLDSSGTQLVTRVVRAGNYQFTNISPTPVVLDPGATAYFNLAYSDVTTGTETSCPTAAQIDVTPPNAVDHDVVRVQMMVCNGGTVTVSPVFAAGSAASQTTAPPQA
ncbi:MAG TPA: DUF4232 domain-containing protein [Acidimicrobiales bacterium]|nr:DUF4232 domain-containing protein [Acidimicrobiales bacterium]